MNRLLAVLGFVLGFSLAALTLGAAHGLSDPPISFYYPSHGWAAQSHAEGHNGYGPSNFPTWYGGTAKDGGENACQTSRYTNIQAAGSISTSSTVGTGDWPGGLVLQYVGCGVLPTSRTLFTAFMTSTGGGSPGYTYHTQASAG